MSHRQQVEPLAGLDHLGKVPDRSRVAYVALLRHVGHEQVISYQPFHRFTFFGCQAKPGADASGNLGPENGVVFGPSLADVVQQQGDIHHLPVNALLQNG